MMKTPLLPLIALLITTTIPSALSWEIGREADPSLLELTCFAFLSDQEGWAAGHTGLLRTEDGGASWDVIYQVTQGGHPHFQTIWFSNRQTGWAASFLGLLQTEDGGENWHQKADGGYFDLCFVDEHLGWAVGFDGHILHTSDGGENWEHQESHIEATHLKTVYFVNENRGWIAGDSGTLLTTQDGGREWSPSGTSLRGNLAALQFLSPEEGWVLSSDLTGSRILHTLDGGENWEEELRLEGYFIADLSFVNPWEGWAVGGRSTEVGYHSLILHTADSGQTWEQFDDTVDQLLYGIGHMDEERVYAAGTSGVILTYGGPLRPGTVEVNPSGKRWEIWAWVKTE